MKLSAKIRIGIVGGENHIWVSVDRTRKFYIEALEKDYEIVFLNKKDKKDKIDLLLNFFGEQGWVDDSYSCPKLFCIHGGAILDQNFLLNNLKKITNQDGLLVNCKSDMEIIKMYCESVHPKLFLLPLPIHEKVFYSIDKQVAKSIMEIDENTISIGLVSRLLPQKNPHVFLKMIHTIKQQTNKKINAWIVGDYWVDYPVLDYVTEDYPTYLKNKVKELELENEVIFLPANLTDSELNCFYNAMDFIIHPTNSLDENFGYVPVEAMACGTPAIGAWYGGLKDSIPNEKIGLGIPTYPTENGIRMDTVSVLNKTVDWINNGTFAQMKEDCLTRVENNYSFQSFANKLRHSIQELLQTYSPELEKKIITKNILDEKLEKDDLPKTSNQITWNHYKPLVEKYVSHKVPKFEKKDFVYLDCNYKVENNKWQRDDPAWPAIYSLNADEIEICNYCKTKHLQYETCIKEGFSIKIIQKLIHKGVIIISKNKWI